MGRILQFNTGFACNLSYNELCVDIVLYGGVSGEIREACEEHTHVWNVDEDFVYVKKYLQEFISECNFTPVDLTTYPFTPDGTQQLYDDLCKNIQLVNSGGEYYNYILGCVIHHQLLYVSQLVAKYTC